MNPKPVKTKFTKHKEMLVYNPVFSVIQSLNSGEAILANTDGDSAWPHPRPKDTMPTAMPSCTAAPPESPCKNNHKIQIYIIYKILVSQSM